MISVGGRLADIFLLSQSPQREGIEMRRHRLILALVLTPLTVALLAPGPAGASGPRTVRVSISTGGVQGDNDSISSSSSADGRFVAFVSFATTLVAGDTNGVEDVFVRDRKLHKTRRVSISTGGVQGDNDSISSSISTDGRFVAFESDATALVAGDTNGVADVFVRGPLR
jgi:hypothetical protein